jgi:hypothetical protein
MPGLRVTRRTFFIAAIEGLVAAAFVSGCSEGREPLPVEARTPGELKAPPLGRDAQPVAKSVNQQAPRSIKEIQPKP